MLTGTAITVLFFLLSGGELLMFWLLNALNEGLTELREEVLHLRDKV